MKTLYFKMILSWVVVVASFLPMLAAQNTIEASFLGMIFCVVGGPALFLAADYKSEIKYFKRIKAIKLGA